MSSEKGESYEEPVEEIKEEKSLTAKEIKALARPEFSANPDKFYPTKTLASLGFSRNQCKCKNFYWRRTEKRDTCGDSQCVGKYTFIGVGTGRGREGKKITYAEAWEGFSRSLSTARVPCTPIPRYPVVARWRADVDYVAAGIFCFQPYCVTGELAPPANPLICPQFCLRFNDLDNIGLTGRHYSGFIMLGIQVFNSKDNFKFWHEDCVAFNYRWLTEELGIDPDEITFIEDVWAGGGNLGPSIEYFVGGLELGNMVFMQYKTFPDGRREPLQVQVIDVGIGLERVPWLVNGSPTSYVDVFPRALNFMLDKLDMKIDSKVWEKFGPLSCLLNVDEVDDVDKTWDWIGKEIGMAPAEVKAAIEPIRDLYVVLDHTRAVLMAIEDGSLPSNVGGAANVRNILRRVFAILAHSGWWEKLGMDGLIELFEHHRQDLATIYGPFRDYKSFRPVIELEYKRWKVTDEQQKVKVERLLKKKGGKLELDDWISCLTSLGVPAETVAEVSGQEIPGNLHAKIAENAERTVRAQPTVLYNTAHLPPTDSLYFADHHMYSFEGKILEVIPNVAAKLVPNIVVLDRSAFYPTSGGQEHDTGTLEVDGETYAVVDVMKVGPAVLHVLDRPLPAKESLEAYCGMVVKGSIDEARRAQLRNNHTATHIVFAAARTVLGPHVWQHGAKKTVERAHLDFTHYDSLSADDVMNIETEANRIVHKCRDITKTFMPKDEAERQHGFVLYQGGVVPGNELRVVQIAETDVEACCGTHADNTSEVGAIKIIKAARISDGVVRLYFVAGENALKKANEQAKVLSTLMSDWMVSEAEIVPTARRFFEGYKKLGSRVEKQTGRILELQIKCHLLDPAAKNVVFKTDEDNARLFISYLPQFAKELKDSKKSVAFVGNTFLYALCGDKAAANVDEKELGAILAGEDGGEKKKPSLITKTAVTLKVDKKDKAKDKSAGKVDGILELTSFAVPNPAAVFEYFVTKGFADPEGAYVAAASSGGDKKKKAEKAKK